jgi:hypothetical protein
MATTKPSASNRSTRRSRDTTAATGRRDAEHLAAAFTAALDAHLGTDPDAVTAEALAAVDRPGPLRSGLKSVRHRNKRALRPWLIAAGVFAGTMIAWLLGLGMDASTLVGVAAPVLGLLAAGGAAALYRGKLAAWLPQGWLPWLIGAVVDAAVWIGIVAADGLTLLRFAWWLISTVLFGLRWWSQVRLAYPDGPRQAPALDDPTAAARLIEKFTSRLACKGGPLEGARLTAVEPYQHGLTGIIELVGGKQSLATVMSVKPRISTALGYYDDDIVIEHNRARLPSQLDIQVVTRSPIKENVYFDLPVYRDGKILLGPYADGKGGAVFVLYTDDSMESGYILGSKGSGKSRVIETIALTALDQTPTVVVYLDGQDGASSPLLWEHALWRGGPKEAATILASLLRIKNYRQKYNRYHRRTGFAPTPEMPGILVIVDECHEIFGKGQRRWAKLCREGRKVGIAILAASQVTTLDAFGGAGDHGDVIRSSLVSSNGIALRTLSKVQSAIFPGLSVDLTALPKIPGYGYTIAESDEGALRTAPFRGRFLVYERQAATLDLPTGVRTAESWFVGLPAQKLDPRSAAAAGAPFANRHAHAEAERAELERMFDGNVDFDQFLADLDDDEDLDAQPVGREIPADELGGARVVSFRKFIPAPVPNPRQAADLTEAQTTVYAAVAAGHTSPTAIAEAVGVSRQAIHKHLDKLIAGGHLTNDRGTYTTATPTR